MDVNPFVGVSCIKLCHEFYLFYRIKSFKTGTGTKLCMKDTLGCNEASSANTFLGLSILANGEYILEILAHPA